MAPAIAGIVVGDDPAAWARLGFAVDEGRTTVGATAIDLDGRGGGIRSWTLHGVEAPDLDGLPTSATAAGPAAAVAIAHPNAASHLDHVVVTTPDLTRTLAALERAGLELRRMREHSDALHQGFFRLGETILEVAGPPEPAGDGPARLWGLVAVVPDVDALAAQLGPDALGAPRAAVQPGRRIVTVRREAGLGTALAFITP